MLLSTGAAFLGPAVRAVAPVHIAEAPCLSRSSSIPYRLAPPVKAVAQFICPAWFKVENLGSAADILMFMWAGALRALRHNDPQRLYIVDPICSLSATTTHNACSGPLVQRAAHKPLFRHSLASDS